jgi:hypothetical protein
VNLSGGGRAELGMSLEGGKEKHGQSEKQVLANADSACERQMHVG